VDGWDKPGHDEKASHLHAVKEGLKMLAPLSVSFSARKAA
jgi:hypothetical protein